jgi:glyoxylase-like metal-dependent hydrolase (beta-lactamase superfamily II)
LISSGSTWTRAALCVVVSLCSLGAAVAAVPARPPTPSGGFHIIPIDAHTYAISEPKYWQENVSYLLIGSRRALLFDTGPGIYSIRKEVAALTLLPVVVIPSHLHFDHVGDLEEFDDVRLLDTPALRAQVHHGYFVEPPSQYLLRTPIKYRVHGWIKDGQTLDLGGRTVRLISTPGHTPDSLSVIEAGGARLFTGDIVNRIVTLCDVPGSDVKAMAASLQRLLQLGQPGSSAYEAHSESPLTRPELEQLAGGIRAIAAGTATSAPMCLGGTPMRRFNVGAFPIVLPVSADATLKPLGSVTETLNWEGGECGTPHPSQ